MYFDLIRKINDRADIVLVAGNISKRAEHIDLSYRLRRALHAMHLGCNTVAHLNKYIIFQSGQTFLCTEHRAFELLELIGDVSLTVCECLLANVIFRDSVRVGTGNLDIVAEHTIITDFQLRNTGFFAFLLLDSRNFSLAAAREITKRVNLLVIAAANQTAVSKKDRRLLDDSRFNQLAHILKQVNVSG